MEHLINRLRFELHCSDEESAFNFRENFAATFQGQITNAADELCSKYVGEEEWLRIDKIEIDLGKFTPGAFNTNFAEVFKSKFEKELKQKLSGISSIEKKASGQISRLEILKYFLQKGVLPWWAVESEVNIDDLAIELITNKPETIKQFFYDQIYNNNVWLRTVFQLNRKSKLLLFLLIDELKAPKDLFVKWKQQLNVLFKSEIAAEINITDDLIDDIILKNTPRIFQNLGQEDILLEIFKNNISSIFTDNQTRIDKIISDNKSDFLQVNYKLSGDKKNETIINTSVPQQKFLQKNNEEDITNKYVVKHAGIILLAPFLKAYFTNLQLLHDKEWKNKDAQYKAVHLLKFLSTGTQNIPEYNLTLEKIMCGLNIEEPLPLEVFLDENEMNESTSLLESVIEHWKALKNTSVYSLRESFLKRDGLLTIKDNGWLLQVERKTLDVLIDSIPWGYSILNFPWSDRVIFVEW
ncbi:MAG: contractile injection system tape measure protein [Ginsengibacter sp.]